MAEALHGLSVYLAGSLFLACLTVRLSCPPGEHRYHAFLTQEECDHLIKLVTLPTTSPHHPRGCASHGVLVTLLYSPSRLQVLPRSYP
jgi:hypothetical protein